jgi:hypothetical protein
MDRVGMCPWRRVTLWLVLRAPPQSGSSLPYGLEELSESLHFLLKTGSLGPKTDCFCGFLGVILGDRESYVIDFVPVSPGPAV